MRRRVELTARARSDIGRLYAFVLERKNEREGGDMELAERALQAIAHALDVVRQAPFTCRHAEGDPHARELVIPFGRSGYLALFDIIGDDEIRILAVRHQREIDYGE